MHLKRGIVTFLNIRAGELFPAKSWRKTFRHLNYIFNMLIDKTHSINPICRSRSKPALKCFNTKRVKFIKHVSSAFIQQFVYF